MPDHSPVPPEEKRLLMEKRYSLGELLREVDLERKHSVLGLELVDQGEIGAIFKTRPRRKRGTNPQN